jgi:sensor histidine kinase regulating citrate/malate metabolism
VFIENTFSTEVLRSVTTALLRFEPQHANVRIDTSSVQEKCRVIFNPVDLSEVLAVLIQNSLDAFASESSPGGAQPHCIQVATEQLRDKVKIIVHDDGPGVPETFRDRVFENGVSGRSGSRGFGLNFAFKCVTKYGGTISLDSASGRGARFVIEVSTL